MRFHQVVCAFLLAWGSLSAHADEDRWLEYSGVATYRHSAQFAYGERHSLRYQGDRLAERVVLYECPDGSAFARKTVSYTDAMAPDFLFEDASNGMREGVRSGPSGRAMLYRASRRESERTSAVPQETGLVIDAGFDEFIRARWQDLLHIGPQPLPFLVPSRQERMSFHVEHLRPTQIDGQPAEVFRMQLDGVFGWVAPGIDVAYDAADHWLLRYEGLSNLRDGSGNNFQVQVAFKPTDRKAGTAAADRVLRETHLAPCH
jgi:hypothetical protein